MTKQDIKKLEKLADKWKQKAEDFYSYGRASCDIEGQIGYFARADMYSVCVDDIKKLTHEEEVTMSKIEAFNEAKKDHRNMVTLIEDAKKPDNSFYMHRAKKVDSLAIIQFSFSVKSCGRHEYRMTDRLSHFIGKACEALKFDIINKAIEKSEDDLEYVRNRARREAEEVLKEMEVSDE